MLKLLLATAREFLRALRPFDAESVLGSHRPRSLASLGGLSLASQVVQTAIRLTGMIILGRLLPPETFGLLAMVLFFQGILGIFNNLGLSEAGVQAERLDLAEISGIYWTTVLSSALCGSLLAFSGPLLSYFYGYPEIAWLCVLAGVSMGLDGTNTARWILLSRAKRTEISLIVLTGSATIGLLATIWLAIEWRSVWALSWGSVAGSVFQSAALFIFVRFRPAFSLQFARVRRFFRYGIGSMFNGLAFHLTQNVQTVVMGRYASAADVGLYNRGQTLFQLPVNQLTTSFGGALYLNMCGVQQDREAVLQLVLRGCWLLGLLLNPFAIIILCFGDWIIAWLLGPAWHEAGQVTRILAAGSLLGLTLGVVFRANNAIGRPARAAMISLWSVPVFVVGVAMIGHQGAIAVAWWFAIYRTLLVIPSTWSMFHGSGLRFRRFFPSYSILLGIGLGCACVMFGLRMLVEPYGSAIRLPAVSLAAAATLGGTFFVFRFHEDGRQVLDWLYRTFGERFGLSLRWFQATQA